MYSFYIENPEASMYSYAIGTRFLIYLKEKNSGRIYITEPTIMNFDINEENIKVICKFNVPLTLVPGVYCVQLKARNKIDDNNFVLNSIPTLEDELQFTIVDTPNMDLNWDLIAIGSLLTGDDVKWKEKLNENN